jgi:AcrR family transcriptional regulator
MFMSKRIRRLTREDWAKAALSAIARGGVAAVAVEPIAAKLGATKGSFYWHFESRDALIEAALELWEQLRTDAVIEFLEQEPDPARRLRTLIDAAYERGPSDKVEIALLSNPNNRVSIRTMRRVVERRVAYVANQLEALGWTADEARDRALLIGYLYVGRIQMAHLFPKIGEPEARRRRELIFNTLVAGGVLPPTVGDEQEVDA